VRPAAKKWSPAASPEAASQAVFLVGFMGAGKSTVGRALAGRLNWNFEDLDDRIERREARTVSEMFRTSGEQDFRRAEFDALREVLDELHSGGDARVVALGGGAFVQPAISELLKRARIRTMFLDAPIEELWRRCQRQADLHGVERPLLSSRDQFWELYRIRRPGYLQATLRIETSGHTIEAVAEEIALVLKKSKSQG
jgi:shikimate kinase